MDRRRWVRLVSYVCGVRCMNDGQRIRKEKKKTAAGRAGRGPLDKNQREKPKKRFVFKTL